MATITGHSRLSISILLTRGLQKEMQDLEEMVIAIPKTLIWADFYPTESLAVDSQSDTSETRKDLSL